MYKKYKYVVKSPSEKSRMSPRRWGRTVLMVSKVLFKEEGETARGDARGRSLAPVNQRETRKLGRTRMSTQRERREVSPKRVAWIMATLPLTD
ncbi:hypothetical protein AAFF_G00277570 [Aldrovandia affinis]|uniref:Uncharacterized protein n=1 Tax=Aldrovandia affinis TaxID=143900 RepID=A0AAD7RA82_9TELE|nr:hypothetical protein AAFF_G00277570 [Aldrovandia affinis]